MKANDGYTYMFIGNPSGKCVICNILHTFLRKSVEFETGKLKTLISELWHVSKNGHVEKLH